MFRETPTRKFQCSQTCLLSPSYNTFCRNMQKWNLSCFENPHLVVFILNLKLWHVRSNYSQNCYKTKVVWNFLIKTFLLFTCVLSFCWKLTHKPPPPPPTLPFPHQPAHILLKFLFSFFWLFFSGRDFYRYRSIVQSLDYSVTYDRTIWRYGWHRVFIR